MTDRRGNNSSLFVFSTAARAFLVCTALLRSSRAAAAFVPLTTITTTARTTDTTRHHDLLLTTTTPTLLYMGKARRGNLSSLFEDGQVLSVPKQPKKNKSKTTNRAASGGGSGGKKSTTAGISPDLAKWMESQQQQQQQQQQDKGGDGEANDDPQGDDDSVTFTPFRSQVGKTSPDSNNNNNNNSGRRARQAERIAAEQAHAAALQDQITLLQQVLLEKNAAIDDILAPIRSLLDMRDATSDLNLKALLAASKSNNNNKRRLDYRLAWVGSDEAISHIGTGLHKVPLARLQEVFMSFPGRNVCQMLEVIRIMGPFPNVKNVLQGTASYPRNNNFNDADDAADAIDWTITWESMVDGTGKEVLAGTAENIRVVKLQVYLAHPSVVIAVVPPEKQEQGGRGRRDDPLQDKGKYVLVFVSEENLEEKLEALRVA